MNTYPGMDLILMLVVCTLYFLADLPKCSAKRRLPIHLARSAISTTSLPPTSSPLGKSTGDNSSLHDESVSLKIKLVDGTVAPKFNDCSASNGAFIKGQVPNDHVSKVTTAVRRCSSEQPTTKHLCRTTAEVCRYTLPPVQTSKKFLIGARKQGKFSMEIHKNPPGGHESCCHPGGGLPMIPDEFDEELPTHDDPLYQKALSGELAEQIVDTIFKKSEKKGNPVMDPVVSETQLKALSRTLENSMLEREGCCYKLSGELKCFLAFLLLQRPTRRKRSCGCSDFGNEVSGTNEFHVDGLSSVNLPVGLFGFQPPPLMNLP